MYVPYMFHEGIESFVGFCHYLLEGSVSIPNFLLICSNACIACAKRLREGYLPLLNSRSPPFLLHPLSWISRFP